MKIFSNRQYALAKDELEEIRRAHPYSKKEIFPVTGIVSKTNPPKKFVGGFVVDTKIRHIYETPYFVAYGRSPAAKKAFEEV